MKKNDYPQRCILVVIPFATIEGTQKFEELIKHLSKNILDVDDDFYEDLLVRAKKHPHNKSKLLKINENENKKIKNLS